MDSAPEIIVRGTEVIVMSETSFSYQTPAPRPTTSVCTCIAQDPPMGTTPATREFFQNLIERVSQNATWICSGATYCIDHRTQTFRVVRYEEDLIMAALISLALPLYTNYQVKE